MTLGVEDSGGEDQGYIELDGTNETVDVLQPMTVSDVTVDVLTITGANANPSAAGDIVYDNDISTLTGGALMWQDDDATDRIIVDLDTAPALDEYVSCLFASRR